MAGKYSSKSLSINVSQIPMNDEKAYADFVDSVRNNIGHETRNNLESYSTAEEFMHEVGDYYKGHALQLYEYKPMKNDQLNKLIEDNELTNHNNVVQALKQKQILQNRLQILEDQSTMISHEDIGGLVQNMNDFDRTYNELIGVDRFLEPYI